METLLMKYSTKDVRNKVEYNNSMYIEVEDGLETKVIADRFIKWHKENEPKHIEITKLRKLHRIKAIRI